MFLMIDFGLCFNIIASCKGKKPQSNAPVDLIIKNNSALFFLFKVDNTLLLHTTLVYISI